MSSVVQFVNEEDGVEANIVDENRKRDFMRAFYGDMMLGDRFAKANPGDFANPYPNNNALYAQAMGGSATPNGVALQVTNIGGLVHQYLGADVPDGITPQLQSCFLAADELLTTLSTGDPTNPRIDIIEVKIDFVDVTESRDIEDANGVASSQTPVTIKKARITKNVVAGTPAAAPAIPSGTAGYVPWCYVWVPATHAAAFTDLEVSDQRIPLGYSRQFIPANMGVPAGSVWTQLVNTGNPRRATTAGEVLYFSCPSTDAHARLMAVHIHADTAVDVEMFRVQLSSGSMISLGAFTNTNKIHPAIPGGSTVPSATVPMAWWCNGYGHPTTDWDTTDVWALMIKVTSRLSANQDLFGVTFELAGTV